MSHFLMSLLTEALSSTHLDGEGLLKRLTGQCEEHFKLSALNCGVTHSYMLGMATQWNVERPAGRGVLGKPPVCEVGPGALQVGGG